MQDSQNYGFWNLQIGQSATEAPIVHSGASLTLADSIWAGIMTSMGTLTVDGLLTVGAGGISLLAGTFVISSSGTLVTSYGTTINVGSQNDLGAVMQIAGIANVAAYCCLFADAGQITITATGHLTVDGLLIMIYAGNVTTNGTLTVATDGTMKLGDDHGGSFNVGATGRLNLTGILIVASQGGFAIDPAGTFAIQPGATLDLDPAATLDFTVSLGPIPVPSDVRFGVPVGDGSGTCYVPTADYVALGTPIDATTGTAVLTEANVQAAIAQLQPRPWSSTRSRTVVFWPWLPGMTT